MFEGLEENGVETFIDDVNAHSEDFETHVPILEDTFKRCLKWRVTLNGSKCTLNNDHSIFLGHEVDGDGHRHTDKRLQGVADLKEPANKKQIKPYIGYVNYFRDYCGMDFAD